MQVRTNLEPGDIGDVIALHGRLYAQEFGLNHTFAGYVAVAMGEFAKAYDEQKDRLWLAEADGQLVGSIAVAGLPEQTAQLRFFLIAPSARGQGLGRRLLADALAFCCARGFKSVFLWTMSDLQTAAHLYHAAGFRLTEQRTHEIWGTVRTEERYELLL